MKKQKEKVECISCESVTVYPCIEKSFDNRIWSVKLMLEVKK